MVSSFKSFASELQENSLYSNDAERAALVADKDRVAAAFMFNFLGMLGMVNAATPAQRDIILKFLKKDKQVRLASIGDDNHDMSLAVKVAHEAGFFKQDITANEITRFLFKLKSGQINSIDSTVVASWLRGMTPSFRTHLKDPKMRDMFDTFVKDGGTTIDVSRFAVGLKKRMNKVGDGGDYQRYAKRFFGLTEVPPQATQTNQAAPVADPVANQAAPVVDPVANQAAPVVDPVANQAAPKLSYYQRQKLKKQKEYDDQRAAEVARAEAAKKAAASIDTNFKQVLMSAIPILVSSGSAIDLFNVVKRSVGLEQAVRASDLPDKARAFYVSLIKLDEELSTYFRTGRRGGWINVTPDELLADINSTMDDTITPAEFFGAFATVDVTSLSPSHYPFLIYASLVYSIDGLLSKLMQTVDVGSARQAYDHLPSRDMKKQLMDAVIRANIVKPTDVKYVLGAIQRSSNYNDKYAIVQTLNSGFVYDYVAAQDIGYIAELYPNSDSVPITLIIAFGSHDNLVNTTDINPVSVERLRKMVVHFIENVLLQQRAVAWFDTVELSSYLFRRVGGYDPSLPENGGTLFTVLHDAYVDDIYENGLSQSKLNRIHVLAESKVLKLLVNILGIDLDRIRSSKHDSDPLSINLVISSKGAAAVEPKELADVIRNTIDRSGGRGSITATLSSIGAITTGDRDANHAAIASAMLVLAKNGHRSVNPSSARTNVELMNSLSVSPKETVLDWLRFGKTSDGEYVMSGQLYKDLETRHKPLYVAIISGMAVDSIGTDVEDRVNDIIESLAPHVRQKIRSSVVGSQVLIDEIESGEIVPFDKIDNARLKNIFLYNDIDLASVMSSVTGKKKKSETFTQYIQRAKADIANSGSLLPEPQVEVATSVDSKSINKTMIQRDHAGRHGDIFPKIRKVFNSTSTNPEFNDFRENSFGDGEVVPAYHGTGGIAAGMILRYGFRVIKPSDSSVVGRMLGDGIYFSNKIDKAMQYVSNGGYSRRKGQKGYLLSVDVNLGKKGTNYNVAGLGGDNIRSPEWCVFDPKAQLRITQIYEVELTTKKDVDKFLSEDVYSSHVSRFKQYITEQTMSNYEPTTTFIFRDGMIPIVDQDTSEIQYVDFEEALSTGVLSRELYDITSQGPAVVFTGTPTTEMYDERYASMMIGDGLQLYIDLFRSFHASE